MEHKNKWQSIPYFITPVIMVFMSAVKIYSISQFLRATDSWIHWLTLSVCDLPACREILLSSSSFCRPLLHHQCHGQSHRRLPSLVQTPQQRLRLLSAFQTPTQTWNKKQSTETQKQHKETNTHICASTHMYPSTHTQTLWIIYYDFLIYKKNRQGFEMKHTIIITMPMFVAHSHSLLVFIFICKVNYFIGTQLSSIKSCHSLSWDLYNNANEIIAA